MTETAFATIRDDDQVPARLRGGVVAIGNFDGVHRGHRAVLCRVVDIAGGAEAPALALTFEPHPRSFFRPDTPVFRLTPPRAKARLLADLGLDGLIEVTFDKEFAATSAEDFVDRIIVGRLGASAVVVGYDFHFGKGRTGSPKLLEELGRARGFDVEVIGPAGEEDTVWSASAAREALAEGDVEGAAHILGYNWFIHGKVEHGAKRGRDLGFPTANIPLPPETDLLHGVYAVRMRVGDVVYDGAANYGRRPQFDNGAPVLEVYVLDASPDLYGKDVEVEFVAFVRPEQRFGSVEDLVERMQQDVAEIRGLLRSGGPPGKSLSARAAR